MNVRTLKLIGIPVITVVNLLAGFLPYFFISRNVRLSKGDSCPTTTSTVSLSKAMKRFLSLANFFCGGVFLATCLIGLYPGVNNKFNRFLKRNPKMYHYPYAGLVLALGFFLVWMLEVLVHGCIHSDHGGHAHTHTHSNDESKDSRLAMTKSVNVTQIDTGDTLLNEEKTSQSLQESVVHETHSHVPIAENLLGSIMLTFALGSHSVIEGLGFGVMDDVITTINMLLTIVAHESICALSLGVNIASRRTPLKAAIVLIVVFSILIPSGIVIGLIVDLGLQKNDVGEVTVASLQGIAAGTFIYVIFIEILPKELSHKKDPLLSLFLMILGFSLIAVMKMAHSKGETSPPMNQSSYTSSTIPSLT